MRARARAFACACVLACVDVCVKPLKCARLGMLACSIVDVYAVTSRIKSSTSAVRPKKIECADLAPAPQASSIQGAKEEESALRLDTQAIRAQSR